MTSDSRLAIDELIEARWVVPVEPSGAVFEDHAVALHRGRIVEVLPIADARLRYVPDKLTVLPSHALIPGLINLHTHAAMNLMRGIGDDLPLPQWLQQRIWPIEQSLVSHDFVLDGTRLACREMLRGGITCFQDMYFFPDAAAQAVLECGMRAAIGVTVLDLPTAWASDAEDYLNKGLEVRDRLRDEPLLSFTLAPHAPYTVGDRTFERIAILSEQLGAPIQIHVHETEDEIRNEMVRHGCRPIARLERLGLIGPQLMAIHAVHLDDPEIALLAERGVTVVHCPASNLKLGSGIAPISQSIAAGIRIGIGTDGAASNNRLDMFSEMRLAALLAKGASRNAETFPACDVLRAATLSAATALGLDQRIGSIEAGKDADLVAVDFNDADMLPFYDVISQLIHVASRECVSHVWVRGTNVAQMRQLVNDSKYPGKTEGASTLSLWQNRIRDRMPS